jgi:hypothetical protein
MYSVVEGKLQTNFNPYRLSILLWYSAGMNLSTDCIGSKWESVFIATIDRPREKRMIEGCSGASSSHMIWVPFDNEA